MRIDDPVFGAIAFDKPPMNLWTKQDQLEIVGGPILLTIDADERGPTQAQRQAYLNLKQADTSLKPSLQKALFEFYRIEREEYARAWDGSIAYTEKDLPIIESSEQVWSVITPETWLIVGLDYELYPVGKGGIVPDSCITWFGCWDIEHSFGAVFKEGQLLRVAPHGDF